MAAGHVSENAPHSSLRIIRMLGGGEGGTDSSLSSGSIILENIMLKASEYVQQIITSQRGLH